MKTLVVLDRAGTVAFSGPTFSNLAATQMKYADVNFSSVGAGDDSAATAGGGASGGGGGAGAGAASSGGGRGPAATQKAVHGSCRACILLFLLLTFTVCLLTLPCLSSCPDFH
eukprot:INCI16394.8.p1 GENE.INCI16394.8~~INCI16394.8.p1  ORF type:complete len:113 (+),score=24.10 INCI16394.8:700-1038(+)